MTMLACACMHAESGVTHEEPKIGRRYLPEKHHRISMNQPQTKSSSID